MKNILSRVEIADEVSYAKLHLHNSDVLFINIH